MTNAAAMTGTNDLPLPVQDLDQDYAGSHWAGWVESPKRDPFLLIKPVVAAPPRTNFFVHFVLKAIWRQNGASLAAINDGVYRLGDSLDEYRVQSIGNQGVWLEVNSHKEFISFDVPGPDSGAEGGPQPEPEPAQPGVGAPGSAGPDTTNLVHSAQTRCKPKRRCWIQRTRRFGPPIPAQLMTAFPATQIVHAMKNKSNAPQPAAAGARFCFPPHAWAALPARRPAAALLLAAVGALTLGGSALAGPAGPAATNGTRRHCPRVRPIPTVGPRLSPRWGRRPAGGGPPAGGGGSGGLRRGRRVGRAHPGENHRTISCGRLDLRTALAMFASQNNLNIVPDNDMAGSVTLDVHNLPLDQMMRAFWKGRLFLAGGSRFDPGAQNGNADFCGELPASQTHGYGE